MSEKIIRVRVSYTIDINKNLNSYTFFKMYIYLNIYMYQWLKTIYDVVKTPTTTKNPEKKPPPEIQIAAILSIENMYQECTIFKICCGLFVSYFSTCIRKLNSLLFIKTIMVYVYFRFLWLLCGCNTSDCLKSKEITIISLIKLTEFLGKNKQTFSICL